jgi:hypothetical protein
VRGWELRGKAKVAAVCPLVWNWMRARELLFYVFLFFLGLGNLDVRFLFLSLFVFLMQEYFKKTI